MPSRETSSEEKTPLWEEKYRIPNLPLWIYTDNEPPSSLADCKAKVSATQFILEDIETQIKIRELELKIGNSRHNSNLDFEKWRLQALKAKQTHHHLLSAYTYWLTLKSEDTIDMEEKLNKLINLLIEEPHDFTTQAARLLA